MVTWGVFVFFYAKPCTMHNALLIICIWQLFILCTTLCIPKHFNVFPERAAKLVEQQERERVLQQQHQQQQQASPRAGTPVGTMMGVVPPPSAMGMLNQAMPPVPGNAKSPPALLKETDAASGHPPTILVHLNHLIPQLINHVTIFSIPAMCPISSDSVNFMKCLFLYANLHFFFVLSFVFEYCHALFSFCMTTFFY